jgi:hypothetical protein
VVDQPPHRSRRIQGLPPEEVEVNPPPPPLRCRLDQSNTFVPTGLVETLIMEPTEINVYEPEVVMVTDLGDEEFAPPFNPPLTGPYTPVLMQVPPPRLDFADSIPLHWVAMEGTPEVSGSGVVVTPTSNNHHQWDISP